MAQPQSFEESSAAYKELTKKLRAITQLQRVESVLSYDQLVFMPQNDAAAAERGAQQSALAGLIHERKTDPKLLALIKEALADLAAAGGPEAPSSSGDAARLLELEEKAFLENDSIPSELAEKRAELASTGYAAWVKARKAADFAAFEGTLGECFETAMKVAEAKRKGMGSDVSLYTTMVDEFEVGMPTERIDTIFAEVQAALVPLIVRVLAAEDAPSKAPLEGKFPMEKQKEISQRIVKAMGYKEEFGRIDVSVHPFSSSMSPSDVRITSRFSDDEWFQGLAATMHEGGHAMYEQNLQPSALRLDNALSMGAHESQSLFWERHVGMSKAFWKWATPIVTGTFDDFNYSADELYGAVNAVTRSLIRVEADELTYPLHVILRYKIEADVVKGRLAVKDIPARWNAEMKELLDIEVPSDAEGCLQDVHWSGLAFGYFPTYLLGSATAAQLAHYCAKDIPDMYEQIERGEFENVRKWLTEKIHRHGSRPKSLDDLLESQLGEKLNPKYFIDYLTEKYTALYKC